MHKCTSYIKSYYSHKTTPGSFDIGEAFSKDVQKAKRKATLSKGNLGKNTFQNDNKYKNLTKKME